MVQPKAVEADYDSVAVFAHNGAILDVDPTGASLSPELALVDPALARRARSRLGPPGPPVRALRPSGLHGTRAVAPPVEPAATLQSAERPRSAVASRPAAFASRPTVRIPMPTATPRLRDTGRTRARLAGAAHAGWAEWDWTAVARAGARACVVLVCGFAALTALSSFAISKPVLEPAITAQTTPPPMVAGERPAGEARAQVSPPAAEPSGSSMRPARGASVSASRRFVWAPAPQARGYVVSFYRGSKRVFSARTRPPSIEVPSRWRAKEGWRRLEPGAYRWYVWPLLDDGSRASKAIVQASLIVPKP